MGVDPLPASPSDHLLVRQGVDQLRPESERTTHDHPPGKLLAGISHMSNFSNISSVSYRVVTGDCKLQTLAIIIFNDQSWP